MQGTPEGVEDNGSLTRVAAFPIGIDPDRFARALEQQEVKAHIAQLLNRYAGRKVQFINPCEAFTRLSMHTCIPNCSYGIRCSLNVSLWGDKYVRSSECAACLRRSCWVWIGWT